MDAADDLVSFVQSRRLIGTLDLFPEVLDLALEEIGDEQETLDNMEDERDEANRLAESYKETLENAKAILEKINMDRTKAEMLVKIDDVINAIDMVL